MPPGNQSFWVPGEVWLQVHSGKELKAVHWDAGRRFGTNPQSRARWAVIHGCQRSSLCEDLLLPLAADLPTASPCWLWDTVHASPCARAVTLGLL